MFITFEGGEGTGKTSIINLLYQELTKQGYKVYKTREPGGSKIAEQIREVILAVENTELDYKAEALLYAASRRQHLMEVIKPKLDEGYIVLCDRYVDSSLAYQGYARGLGIKEVLEVNRYAIDDYFPNLTIFIDLDPKVGIERIQTNRGNLNRLDLEKMAFHNKVYQGYQELIKMYPERIKAVKGHQTLEEVYKDCLDLVMKTIFKKEFWDEL
jgi:dTMP kinase